MIDYVKPRKDYKSKSSIRDYIYRVGGKYEINKGRVYYGRYYSRDDAEKVSDELKRLGWDKSKLEKAQKNVGVKPSNRYHSNTTGYANVTKQKDHRIKQGFSWVYSYMENGNRKRLSDKSLKGLEKKVKDKGLKWERL